MGLHTGLYGYMGAKFAEADHLVELFVRTNRSGQKIDRFVETNFGAGNIVSATAGIYSERISNDLDEQIALLADTVSKPEERALVIDIMLSMEASKMQFKKCLTDAADKNLNKIQRAAAIWYTFRMSYRGDRKGYWHYDDYAEKLLNKVELLETFNGVQIRNMDMIQLLEEEKKAQSVMERTFYYLDPPYLDNKVSYRINRTDVKFHKKLTEVMEGIPYIMISGYDNSIYEENLVKKLGFYKYILSEKFDYMAGSKNGTRDTRTEVIWTSYKL